MNQKNNVVKRSWIITCVFKENPSFTYQFDVEAESEASARLAAQPEIPRGYEISTVEPQYF